jgi:hypothetical protein
MPRDLWRWEIDVDEIADLSTGGSWRCSTFPSRGQRAASGSDSKRRARRCGGKASRRPRTKRGQTNRSDPESLPRDGRAQWRIPVRPPTTYRPADAANRNDNLTARPRRNTRPVPENLTVQPAQTTCTRRRCSIESPLQRARTVRNTSPWGRPPRHPPRDRRAAGARWYERRSSRQRRR